MGAVMNVFELLTLVVIVSGGHFLGDFLEMKFGLTGWFTGCTLGIGLSILFLRLLQKLIKFLRPDRRNRT
jgi:hypothetical protein